MWWGGRTSGQSVFGVPIGIAYVGFIGLSVEVFEGNLTRS